MNYNILMYYDFCFFVCKNIHAPRSVFQFELCKYDTHVRIQNILLLLLSPFDIVVWRFQIFHTIICGYFECHHRWPSTACQSINDVLIGIFIRYSHNITTPYYYINGLGLQLFKSVYNGNNIILLWRGAERIYWEWSIWVLLQWVLMDVNVIHF